MIIRKIATTATRYKCDRKLGESPTSIRYRRSRHQPRLIIRRHIRILNSQCISLDDKVQKYINVVAVAVNVIYTDVG